MSDRIIVIKDKSDIHGLSARLKEYFDKGNKEPVTLQYVSSKPQRSVEQNKYYWGVVIPVALQYYKQNLTDLIKLLMDAFKFSLTKDFIHELFKLRFNKGGSTTEHKTDTFSDEYINQIREHFWHEYEVDIPEPNQPPMESNDES